MDNEKALITNEENVFDLANFRKNSKSDVGTYSNIKDSKELFNLSNNVDLKLNDFVGQKMRIKKVLIRTYDKQLDEPIVNEETGELIETQRKISCVVVDEDGVPYATGSKTFAYKLMSYLVDYNGMSNLDDGIEIEIVKNPTPNGNKSLGFKLI